MKASIETGSPHVATIIDVMNIMYQNDAHVFAELFLVSVEVYILIFYCYCCIGFGCFQCVVSILPQVNQPVIYIFSPSNGGFPLCM